MTKTRERSEILEKARTLKMARSAHAYVRGNTAKFYEWLGHSPVARRIPKGPPVWICGDCHLGNLGPLSDGRGGIEVQIRDLDQTVIGNPALDLIRLGLSLASAARGSDLPGVVSARMIEAMIAGYARALADPDAEIDTDEHEPDAVRTVRRRALGRRWRHLARERIEDAEPVIPLGKRFWKIDKPERKALTALFDDSAAVRKVLSLDPKDDVKTRLVDAAYWMKGCSSLGKLRYAAIVAVKGDAEREDYALIDLKQAGASLAPSARGAKMPQDPAERVVAGACALSPHLGERMTAATILGRAMIMRELMPQDLKIELAQFTRAEAVRVAGYLAWVVGHAHARQLSAPARTAWRRALLDNDGEDMDAPSWLWRSVVDLAGAHEAAYLDHCRVFALASD
ncbi:MAG: DUF2252 family protein [Sphingomonas sp.]